MGIVYADAFLSGGHLLRADVLQDAIAQLTADYNAAVKDYYQQLGSALPAEKPDVTKTV